MRPGLVRHIVFMLSVVFAATGCTTTARVWTGSTAPAAVLPELERGDRLLLLTNAGREHHCPLKGFDAQFFYGCKDPVLLSDVREMRVRRVDGHRMVTVPDLEPGDRVTVTMRSGDVRKFRLETITSDILRGGGVEVAVREAQSILATHNPPSTGNQVPRRIIMGIAVVAAAAALIQYGILLNSLGDEE